MCIRDSAGIALAVLGVTNLVLYAGIVLVVAGPVINGKGFVTPSTASAIPAKTTHQVISSQNASRNCPRFSFPTTLITMPVRIWTKPRHCLLYTSRCV